MTPEEQIAAFLLSRFRASLRRSELGFDDPLISTGIIDSFGMLEVLAFLEDTFGVTIDPMEQEITELETVRQIAALVENARRTA
jgi:acyl carrier protein